VDTAVLFTEGPDAVKTAEWKNVSVPEGIREECDLLKALLPQWARARKARN
jgi:hypothetical protein